MPPTLASCVVACRLLSSGCRLFAAYGLCALASEWTSNHGAVARLPFRLVHVRDPTADACHLLIGQRDNGALTKVAGAPAQMLQLIVTATSHLGFSCSVREDKR
jgi:hypothetical protein